MMTFFGFNEQWIRWIMECVTTVSYSFCVEGLSHYINISSMRGVTISRYEPLVSHLVFTNDSILYSKASIVEARKIDTILKNYREANNQWINLHKSSLIFSYNTPRDLRSSITTLLHISKIEIPDKFLRLPSNILKSRTPVFSVIKDRIFKKNMGWKEHLLSKVVEKFLSRQS
ncbi:hypothetical protein MANES_15G164550v8 [Manihot esculenta]|uniref:Uncharacterized protein n=1 Tax=Manihot esculenta TaxID=3983 RepID=A0ACB7GCM9_MANES|nr:hypothetical protein MANES_15G164550v8 [Manihot esculenta]